MFYCSDCGGEFEIYEKRIEMHGFDSPPFEESFICPYCSSSNVKEKKRSFCKCCGVKLHNTRREYCSDECKKNWHLLWKRELKRRKQLESDPLYELVKELENYNKINKTNLSYGQYIAYVKTKKKASNIKCDKKRKTT